MRKPEKGRAVFHYVLKDVSRIKVSEQIEKEKEGKKDEESKLLCKWLLMNI